MTQRLFDRLVGSCEGDWRAYTEHQFVRGMTTGTLPEPAFRHYLVQDYLFLINFARAYGLAVYKGETLADMRAAAAGIAAILDTEMDLHVAYCAGWGITEAEMQAAQEDPANMAYTRYVLERGMAGDLLDLHVALAPCVIGYGVIGKALAADPATKRDGNPYTSWIGMYAGAEYQELTATAIDRLDALFARRGNENRMAALETTFRQATRLEIGFWQMGLDAV